MAIAKWLHEKCDLTRSGSNWTPQRIISILRNPTYIGLLPFGGEVYEAFHERLVETDQFERAGALLQERGEAWALRRSNPSD
ncbi:MAG: recombinase family protein [Acidimicrobiia bacterium]